MKKRKKYNKKKSSSLSAKVIIHTKDFSPTMRTKLLFIIGITCIFLFASWKIHAMTLLSFSYHPISAIKTHSQNFPKNIALPDSQINLPVFETHIINGIWQIADNGASHLATSANPGDNATVIIYGHNTISRFANLPYVFPGEKILVQTVNKKTYTYVIKQTAVVNPDQIDILADQKGETLIVYTCYGFADLQRFVVVAKPV